MTPAARARSSVSPSASFEVGQREGHQKSLRGKWHLEVANLEDDFAPFERVHLVGRQPQQAVARVSHQLL
jgi:hypothetical protein